jgi:hypothetical protein
MAPEWTHTPLRRIFVAAGRPLGSRRVLSLVLILFSVLGVVAVGTRRLKWPAEHMPLWALAMCLSAFYGAALSGVLKPVFWGLLATGWALLAWQLAADRHRLRELAASVATPGVVLFVALSVATWAKYHGGYLTIWDEFSHWGVAIKELAATHQLSGPGGAIAYKDYPPGTALWLYGLITLAGWSEGAALAGQAVLLWAVLAVLLTGVRWGEAARITATVALFYLLVVSFGHDVASLMVDHVLGAWLAGALAMWWTSRQDTPGLAWRLFPVVFALPLIKASGFALALTLAGVMALDAWLGRTPGQRLAPRKLLLAAVIALAPVLAFGSWKLHVAHANFPASFQLTADAAAGAPAEVAAERQRVTLAAFGQALVSRPIGATNVQRRPVIGTLGWLALLGLGLLVVWRGLRQPADRARFAALHLGLAVGGVAYAAGLLWLYLTAFNADEGPRLASFDRYMGTYALVWGLVLAVQLLALMRADGRWRWAATAALAVFLGLLVRFGPYDALSRLAAPAPQLSGLRAQLRAQHLPDPAVLAPGKRRCYVVWQDTSGLEFWMLRYELAPRLVGQTDWVGDAFSLGEPYGTGDVYTRAISARAWSDRLRAGYDYVLVGHADAPFAARFGRLFPGGVRAGFYAVAPQPDGWVALRPVAP